MTDLFRKVALAAALTGIVGSEIVMLRAGSRSQPLLTVISVPLAGVIARKRQAESK